MKFRPTHVAMYLALIFLAYGLRRNDKRATVPWYDWVLFALAGLPLAYIYWDYETVVNRYAYITPLTTLQWVMAALALALTLEACRRTVGLTLVLLVTLFVAQALFGPYFPPPFDQSAVPPMRLADHLFLTTSGLYGSITGISATYVLMFVLLGAVLEQARGGELFMNLATAAMGRARGGPAKAAVLASALFGSISGAAVANVYATGTFTIPLMIRTGFRPRFAAAVEAVASASGQLVPPIMGSAAFLIADFTRTQYVDVATAAALPALLYLFAVYFMVDLETRRYRLPAMDAVLVAQARRDIWLDLHMILVLAVVVAMLVMRYTPFYAAYVGVVGTLVISQLRARTRLGLRKILDGFEIGARRIAPIAAALFVAALVVGVIELSGLGLRFTSILLTITGGDVLLTMLLVMVSCIVLGMGLPTAAAYMIVAIFGAPALIKLGIEPLAAHFFVFYYAIISAITPPVAVAAYAAATIAGTPLQATGVTAMKLGAAVYLVPVVLVYSPALLLIGDAWQIAQALATALVGIVALAACVQGWLLVGLSVGERLLAAGSALALLHGGWQSDLGGAALLAALVAVQVLRRSMQSRRSGEGASG
jgi:TRAP transporter 4TM/12TM fusion protein